LKKRKEEKGGGWKGRERGGREWREREGREYRGGSPTAISKSWRICHRESYAH